MRFKTVQRYEIYLKVLHNNWIFFVSGPSWRKFQRLAQKFEPFKFSCEPLKFLRGAVEIFLRAVQISVRAVQIFAGAVEIFRFSLCRSPKKPYLCTMQTEKPQSHGRPKVAIVDPNTLAALGLKAMLQNVVPIMDVDTFGSFAELEANQPDRYFHYFAAMNVVLEHRSFFAANRRKTIVLTLSLDSGGQLSDFHSLCINVPEKELVRSLLALEQHAHGQGQHMPPMPKVLQQQILTNREVEVMSLIAQGYINKEIAERLSIGLSTVITHRKNIMDKLGMKSVSALTIYAVMHGYVDINKI